MFDLGYVYNICNFRDSNLLQIPKHDICNSGSPAIHWRNLRSIGTLNHFLDKELGGESNGVQTCDTVCKSLQMYLTDMVPQRPERIS